MAGRKLSATAEEALMYSTMVYVLGFAGYVANQNNINAHRGTRARNCKYRPHADLFASCLPVEAYLVSLTLPSARATHLFLFTA